MLSMTTQNLQHGGGNRIEPLMARLAEASPELIVFTEFRKNKLDLLAQACATVSLHNLYNNAPDLTTNSVAVATRDPIAFEDVSPEGEGCIQGKLLKAELDGWSLVAASIPLHKDLDARAYFKRLIELAHAQSILIFGDLNSGDPEHDGDGYKFLYRREFVSLLDAGLIDCYRAQGGCGDFSWRHPRGKGKGFRIDHALASPEIVGRVTEVRYDHSIRSDGLSDHSALHLKLA